MLFISLRRLCHHLGLVQSKEEEAREARDRRKKVCAFEFRNVKLLCH